MNKVYKIIWHAVYKQWVVVSELVRRGKNKTIKLLIVTALASIPTYSVAAPCGVTDPAHLTVSGSNNNCELTDTSYVGTEVKGSDRSVITVNNGAEVNFKANKVDITSSKQNHGLVIGKEFKGENNYVAEGAKVTVEHDMEITVNAETDSPDDTKQKFRPSGILIGDNSDLHVKGNLTLNQTDHWDRDEDIDPTKKYDHGAAIRVTNTQAQTSNITVDGKTVINAPTNGFGILNGDVSDGTESKKNYNNIKGGNLTFNDTVDMYTRWRGLVNNNGNVTFNNNVNIISEEQSAIFQGVKEGKIVVNGNLNVETQKGSANTISVDTGELSVTGVTTIKTTGYGGSDWESSSAIYLSNSDGSAKTIFGDKLIAQTTTQAATGGKIVNNSNTGSVVRIHGGDLYLATDNELTANDLGSGINQYNGYIHGENAETLTITTNGYNDSPENDKTENNAVSIYGGTLYFAKDTNLNVKGNGDGIKMNKEGGRNDAGTVILNKKTTINTAQGDGISIKAGTLNGEFADQLTINTTRGGNAINMQGGELSLAKDTVLTAKKSGHGMELSGGIINLNNQTTINTEDGDAILMNDGTISGMTAKNLTATTSGQGYVVNMRGGNFYLAEDTKLTAEDNGHGIKMSGGSVMLNKSTTINVKSGDGLHVDGGDIITTAGSVLHIHAQEGKAIQINNGSVILQDTNIRKNNTGSAIELAGGEFSNAGTINFLNAQDVAAIHGTVTAGNEATFNNHGSIDISKVTDMEDIIHHDGTGTLVVNNTQSGQLSSQTGHVLTNTAIGTIEAHNNGILTGKIDSGKGKISLENTGLWESTGDSTLTGIHNAGTIQFKHPNSATRSGDKFFTINVKGDYSGDNGIVKMHTIWNAPGDEKGTNSNSDVLNIAGKATGNTTIIPVSADGTENVIDGNVKRVNKVINTIPVVNVAQSSADVAFTGTAQTTGVSEVQLKKRTTDEGKDEYYWSITADTTDPVKPEKTKLIYADAVAGYTLMPRVNLEQGFASLATLRERRGDTFVDNGKGNTWARTFGKHQKQDGKTRLNLDTDIYGLQIGHDFWNSQTANNGLNLLGGYLSYSRANTDFSDQYHAKNGLIIADKKTGKGKSDNISLGLTNTFYAANGTYIDLVGQLSYLHNKYTANTGYNPDSQDGWGMALSAEVGRSIPIRNSNWSIEPQAQLVYQYLDLDTMNDGVRNIDQNNQDALRGRVGLAVSYQAGDKTEPGTSFYSVGNIWHDFTNPSSVTIGRDSIREKTNNTWGEVGVGVKIPIAKQSNIYADVRYEHNFGSSKRQSFRGNIGLNINW